MQKRKEDGVTFVDSLIVIAILGVLISLAVPGLSGIHDGVIDARLKSDVDTINFAIDGFLARGGSLSGVSDPNAILDAIRNHQTSTNGLQHFPAEADSTKEINFRVFRAFRGSIKASPATMDTAPQEFASLAPLERLRAIMHRLRAPGGCPWDAEQTHESLLPHLIEEAYEVAEAIRGGDRDEIVDELGDLLLQPVFHGEIASETGAFDLDDIADAISEKLIRRHPHVFGDAEAGDAEAVLKRWHEIKKAEKGNGGGDASNPAYHIEKSADGLPALMSAQKLQRTAARVGFDWPDSAPVLEKIREEVEEVSEAMQLGAPEKLGEEIGDLLFAVVNLARKEKLDAELLLTHANAKFVRRYQQVEDQLRDKGSSLEEASLQEMDAEWDAVKEQLR